MIAMHETDKKMGIENIRKTKKSISTHMNLIGLIFVIESSVMEFASYPRKLTAYIFPAINFVLM